MSNEQNNNNNNKEQQVNLTIDMVKSFLETNPEGKQLAQSLADSRIQSGIKTFEEKFMKEKLPNLLQEEINKRYPPETPEQKKLRELEEKLISMEREKAKAEVASKTLKYATEKNIPTFIVENFISEDYDSTISKIEEFNNKLNEYILKEVEAKLSGNGRKNAPPTTGGTNNGDLTLEKLLKMTPQERKKIDKSIVENLLKQQYINF